MAVVLGVFVDHRTSLRKIFPSESSFSSSLLTRGVISFICPKVRWLAPKVLSM